jgi:hypothetical protein
MTTDIIQQKFPSSQDKKKKNGGFDESNPYKEIKPLQRKSNQSGINTINMPFPQSVFSAKK